MTRETPDAIPIARALKATHEMLADVGMDRDAVRASIILMVRHYGQTSNFTTHYPDHDTAIKAFFAIASEAYDTGRDDIDGAQALRDKANAQE